MDRQGTHRDPIGDGRHRDPHGVHGIVRLVWGEIGKRQARPANSPVSVETFTISPSLMKRGTRISSPVPSRAGLVTVPLDESPRTPGSVNATWSVTLAGNSTPIGLPLYLSNSMMRPSVRKS